MYPPWALPVEPLSNRIAPAKGDRFREDIRRDDLIASMTGKHDREVLWAT